MLETDFNRKISESSPTVWTCKYAMATSLKINFET